MNGTAPARTVVLVLATGLCLGWPHPLKAQDRNPITSAREAIETGDRLFAEGRVLPACLQYDLALGVAPQWWYPAYKRALCDLLAGDLENARYLLTRAVNARTGLYILHLTLARWHRRHGSFAQARTQYEAAIAQTKGATEPMVELADLLVEQKRLGEARLVLKRAEYYGPANIAVRRRLATVSKQLGRLADTERELRFLALRGVNPRRSLAELALFYRKQNEPELARQVVLQLESLRPGIALQLPPAKGEFANDSSVSD